MQEIRVRRTTSRNPGVQTGLALLTTALMLGAPGCKKPAPAALPPPVVQVMEVTATNVARSIEFIGQLDSPQNVEVRARVEAFVKEVLFTEGTNVVQDQPLFRLDEQPFEQQLAAANGMLAEAKAALNKYEKDVARLQPLAEKKAIPQQDLDNAVASVAVGQANLLSAEARVKSAELNLGYCDVRAPVSGMIGARQVSVGSLVGKGEPTLLATISQLDPIWFYCAISEVDYLHAQRTANAAGRQIGELPVTLILADGSEHPEPGDWVFLDRAVDVTTGTIRARAQFSNPNKLLRPGMFARIRISLRTGAGSILVPERALAELQGRYFVWIVGADQKATQRPVQVAPARIGADVVVLEGLKPGERIVVEGLQKVHEGSVVQPMTSAQLAAAAAAAQAGKPAGTAHGKE
ncbi:MAG: efflux RND transporter periplasmic adaptor subunit [Verrucomicrobia bacterium]|nr:efflux RND transporter periplasmic adaptor subunit [Verrucomicrobiota bacterium]